MTRDLAAMRAANPLKRRRWMVDGEPLYQRLVALEVGGTLRVPISAAGVDKSQRDIASIAGLVAHNHSPRDLRRVYRTHRMAGAIEVERRR